VSGMTATDILLPPRPAAPVVPAFVAPAARALQATKTYGQGDNQVRALDRVDVDLSASQFTAIMGPSGSGKSTLMHTIAGLDSLTSGQVFIGDTDLSTLNDRQLTVLRRERVGFIFQAFNLIPTLTAVENITLPLTLAGRKPDREWLETLLETVGIVDRRHHLPSELSGGQAQRVAVARALITHPAVVFADEPTGNLDSRSATELLTQIRQAVDEYQQSVVMVTHDPRAAAYADRVLFLADGRLVRELPGPTVDLVLDAIRELGGEGGAGR